MRKLVLLSAALAALALPFAGTANATVYGQVTATYTGVSPVSIVYIYADKLNDGTYELYEGVYAGKYNFNVTSSTNLNLVGEGALGTYCIDLVDDPTPAITYDIVDLGSAPIPTTYTLGGYLTPTQQFLLKRLWTTPDDIVAGDSPTAWTGTTTQQNLKAAAFGVAVWEIVAEHSGTLDALSGSFKLGNDATSAAVAAQANIYLNNLHVFAYMEMMPDLYALSALGRQDMMFYDTGGGTPFVPEPLTMLGMFLGLGSVGAYIRKRRMA